MVSVVIPVRDASATLGYQLDALTAQGYRGDWEVVVVDNGSRDDSVRVAETFAGQLLLRIVRAPDTRGASHARNAGLAAARGELLAFCDSDDVVAARWLDGLVRAARDVDVAVGALDFGALNDDAARRAVEIPSDRLSTALDWNPSLIACNCAVWRYVFDAIGGWNERLLFCMDTELGWRAELAGFTIGFAPEAVVEYRLRTRLGAIARHQFANAAEHPQLYRAFRSAGLPRSNTRRAIRTWLWVLARVGDVGRDRSARERWVRTAAGRAGRVCGSIRNGVVYL